VPVTVGVAVLVAVGVGVEVSVGVVVEVGVSVGVAVVVAVVVITGVAVSVGVEVTVSVRMIDCFIWNAANSSRESGLFPNLSMFCANEADTGINIKPANINIPSKNTHILVFTFKDLSGST